jgi:hypothetical protein
MGFGKVRVPLVIVGGAGHTMAETQNKGKLYVFIPEVTPVSAVSLHQT